MKSPLVAGRCAVPLFALTMSIASAPFLPAQSSASSTASDTSSEIIELETYEVGGSRYALQTAQENKQNKLTIVDSIMASDINALPDFNVTDALQRITGVQILRDRGEGAGITVRGLSQMENTLNGREIFTAGLGSTGAPSRTVDFADIPAEMVAAINVYKTASAEHIEGGIGGLVELVTRRPFDFKGLQAIGSIRLIDGDLADSTKPQYSGLVSNRWKLKGGGEIGALVNVIYQERAWREDQKGTGAPTALTNLIPGETVIAPRSTSENTVFGRRERTGISTVLQWRPSDKLELYGEYTYTKFDTLQDTNQINVNAASANTFVPGSVVLTPGTNDLQRITWTNPTISVLSFARDTHDWTKQFAAGAIWKGEKLTLKLDASYTDSYNDLYFVGPFFVSTAGEFTHDLSTTVPSTSVTGTDLTDPANFEYTGIAYRTRPYYGDLGALAIDGTYDLGRGFFQSISAGARRATRNATNKPGLIFADNNFPAGSRPPATTYPDEVEVNPFGFFPYTNTPSIRTYMTGVIDEARDPVPYRAKFGITTPLPSEAGPLTLWEVKETTTAAYLMSTFKTETLPIDGNIGVRFVRTDEAVSGSRTVPATDTTPQTTAPINIDTHYNNVLPSLNARYALGAGLYLRGSASKMVTRPNFNQLSPSLTLVPNPINPELNQGSAGNPDLGPIKSDSLDFAIEKYFNESTSVYATLFYKKVDGFIVSSSETETYDGLPYLITRPRNADPATIKGFEVGYTQFFDFLPARLKGLGMQANYTYIDSETPNATLGMNTPLQNLSENSFNLIGMYETGKISARIAYNWRDEFLSGQQNIANVGRLPFYTKAYGWLDASFSYAFSEHVKVTLEGTNLLRTKRESYYGVETRPQNIFINDRQISLLLTLRL